MCGLAGIVSLDGRPLGATAGTCVTAMIREIAYRGPDDEHTYIDSHVAFGFRRLSIIDLAAGRQPLHSEDGRVVAMANGEIFNHAALRRRLGDRHQLRSASDCEVIPHLYEDRQLAFVEDLAGMYAVAIWDARRRRVVLARDRFGIKPLFYAVVDGLLLFASEIKALLRHPACPRELDWSTALADPWLSGDAALDPSPPVSFFCGIEPVPAGHTLEVDLESGRVTSRRYWGVPEPGSRDTAAPAAAERASWVEQYRELLAESVDQCLMSDVEVGLFLSGGIDSVAIAALARRTRQLHCFTVLSASTLSNEDARHAHLAARRLDLPNHQVMFRWHDLRISLDEWKRLLWLCETPYCGPEQIYKYELHRYAREVRPGLKVMLSGQGSDEFNGGYGRVLSPDRPTWRGLQSTLAELDRRHLFRRVPLPVAAWEDQLERPLFTSSYLHSAALATRDTSVSRDCTAARDTHFPNEDSWTRYILTKMRDLEMYNLWHEDRTAAGNSIENRVPFLDHRLVELTQQVPVALRPQLFDDKRILRDAVAPVLPRMFRFRPKVPFFHGKDVRYTNRMMLGLLTAERGRLVQEAFEPVRGDAVIDLDAMRGAIRDAGADPEAAQVSLLMRLVNLGQLSRMMSTQEVPVIPPRPARQSAELHDWDAEAPALWRQVTSQWDIESSHVPALAPNVAIMRRIDRDGLGEVNVVVNDVLEFVIDAADDATWIRFLCEIDGVRNVAQISRRLRIGVNDIRKQLEEAVDFGIISLGAPRRRQKTTVHNGIPVTRRTAREKS